MHYLHPRSRTTGTLFTATLAVSFLVVAAPHLLPCPVDRRQYADTVEMPDGSIKRRRRKTKNDVEGDVEDVGDAVTATSSMANGRPKRECPVPKPGGLVGQMMGIEQRQKELSREVVIKSLKSRHESDDATGT
ncbi:hypothetical protein LTR86_005759 [Recurvomyces mirabilis]|nr:hypothetical protein LTR86_005759 [Recurvomyces mirabilis]